MEYRFINADRLGAPNTIGAPGFFFRVCRSFKEDDTMPANNNTFFSPQEIMVGYINAGIGKCKKDARSLLLLSVLAGMFIALGCAVANTAVFAMSNPGLARTLSGLLFPFGLCMVIVTGAELFTGNSLLVIPALAGRCRVGAVLRNWALVYVGNFIGAVLTALLCVYCGQLEQGSGTLAAYTIKVAAGKCALSPLRCVGLGLMCNILVCLGVLMSMSARASAGRLMGAFIPVCYFVICGFEHCVANMYYIPAGMLAAGIPEYAGLAAAAGVDLTLLTPANFLLNNLLPVTVGNVLGGCTLGCVMWLCYAQQASKTPSV